jgi:hypothetical protein
MQNQPQPSCAPRVGRDRHRTSGHDSINPTKRAIPLSSKGVLLRSPIVDDIPKDAFADTVLPETLRRMGLFASCAPRGSWGYAQLSPGGKTVITQYQPRTLHAHLAYSRPWDLDGREGRFMLLYPYQGRTGIGLYIGPCPLDREASWARKLALCRVWEGLLSSADPRRKWDKLWIQNASLS